MSVRRAALFLALVALAACGGGNAGDPARIPLLRALLASDGFTIADGSIGELALTDCCDPGNSCYGNNPVSPYLTARVPPSPGQVVANDAPDKFRLLPDEAILLVGKTPPSVAYFGFTPYLFDRYDGAGSRVQVFASLSETLNHEVIGVEGSPGVHDRPTVVIACAHEDIDLRVRAALASAGYPPDSVNTLVFDPTVTSFGLGANDDQFMVFMRAALPEVKADLDAYVAAPPFTVLRLTPSSSVPVPFGRPPARPKDLTKSETSLQASLQLLEDAVKAQFNPTHFAVPRTAGAIPLHDPYDCISGLEQCYGDNRDTLYPASDPILWPGAGDFVVVLGVDHVAAEKVTYASASVLQVAHQAGVVSVTSKEWAGTAAAFAPTIPDVDKLYVYAFARADVGNGLLTKIVPSTACPSGIADGELAEVIFRTYVEPGFHTAPDPSTLLVDRVWVFRAR